MRLDLIKAPRKGTGLDQEENLDGSDKAFLYSLELIVSLDRFASGCVEC